MGDGGRLWEKIDAASPAMRARSCNFDSNYAKRDMVGREGLEPATKGL